MLNYSYGVTMTASSVKLAAPFVTRCPSPLPVAVTTGLLEPTSTLAFKYRLRIGKPLVSVDVLQDGSV